ncbi:MAG: MBL fold metallo-hydrolase [candidate division Zixibacteria bacterium]|nr:MBL fold metallo-hydrolase [candidate division Zixibacteria bacterium]
MFGVVPKKIWGKLLPSDGNNLITMVTNLFLLKASGKNILLDTGLGDVISPVEKKIYDASGTTNIETGLKQIGLASNDIDIVFLTHLHTDHAAGSVKNDNGIMVPRFRKARHIVQRTEWDDAINPNERTAAVYIPDRLRVLEKEGQLDLIDGDTELMPGIKAIKTGGHTPGHQAIEATSDGFTTVYYADIVPSSYHIRVPYVAAVDLNPLETMEVKRRLVKRLLEDRHMSIAFDHDINIKIGRLADENGKIIVDRIE